MFFVVIYKVVQGVKCLWADVEHAILRLDAEVLVPVGRLQRDRVVTNLTKTWKNSVTFTDGGRWEGGGGVEHWMNKID